MGPEALGLSTGPTDLHVLPDGRVLVVSQTEVAFGDGVRWETFRSMPDQTDLLTKVAVDARGRIYGGIPNGIAALELKEGARGAAQVSQAADEASVKFQLFLVAQNQALIQQNDRIINLLEQLVRKR